MMYQPTQGQHERIQGGRDQDLLTPIWQFVALVVLSAWCLGWMLSLVFVIGPLLGYLVVCGGTVVLIIWGYVMRGWFRDKGLIPISLMITGAVIAGYFLDAYLWPSYILRWRTWAKFIWFVFASLMIFCGGALFYTIAIRIFDPNYPSPRKAMDRREWQRPWERDNPAPRERVPQIVRVRVEETNHHGQAQFTELDLPPVMPWYNFARWLLDHPDDFNEETAKRFHVKITLTGNKPPWFGRGFRQVRHDIELKKMGAWYDESNHNEGFELFVGAITAFRGFVESNTPLLGVDLDTDDEI